MTTEQIKLAAEKYKTAVTGAFAGCKHPEALLRWAIEKCPHAECRMLAENYIKTCHGACWNAMINCMPANGWLVWYNGVK